MGLKDFPASCRNRFLPTAFVTNRNICGLFYQHRPTGFLTTADILLSPASPSSAFLPPLPCPSYARVTKVPNRGCSLDKWWLLRKL